MRFDVAIVGGGPAGLAAGIEARQQGLSAVLLERQAFPVDKACGEGLLPAGLAALDRLKVLPHLDRSDSSPFEAIRYVQEDGRFVDGPLPPPGGLGVRRLALARAMVARARECGVDLRDRTGLRAHVIEEDGVRLATDAGDVEASLLVAADGLHSPLRRAQGLERTPRGPLRYGLRRHVAMAPWGPRVEVHFSRAAEAYVTPAGAHRVGIAFLWRDGALTQRASFEALLDGFWALKERVRGAPYDSEARGAGPLRQAAVRRTKRRFALLGDAGGYVDAITGEGLTLALRAARALGEVMPAAVQLGTLASLEPYERAAREAFAAYARFSGALVWVAARPRLRRFLVNRLIETPRLFAWGVASVLSSERPPQRRSTLWWR